MSAVQRNKVLRDRSLQLRSVRDFFLDRGATEVDTPLLSAYPPIDPFINILSVDSEGEERFLHTSPEYAMKRLLSEGLGDIFQLGHVYRSGESGQRHNPEFTMLEWYRIGWTLSELQEEVCQIVELFLGKQKRQFFTYHEIFQKFLDWDLSSLSLETLTEAVGTEGLDPVDMDRDDLLNAIFGLRIEPHLGKDCITVISDYPPTQAELSKVVERNGELVAERFEVFVQGYELANGYGELLDPEEQSRRFQMRNEKRQALGKRTYAIDPRFIGALQQGLPDCCGVAVGFDRLMMLRHEAEHIREILPFSWTEA